MLASGKRTGSWIPRVQDLVQVRKNFNLPDDSVLFELFSQGTEWVNVASEVRVGRNIMNQFGLDFKRVPGDLDLLNLFPFFVFFFKLVVF